MKSQTSITALDEVKGGAKGKNGGLVGGGVAAGLAAFNPTLEDAPHKELPKVARRFMFEDAKRAFAVSGTEVNPYSFFVDYDYDIREAHYRRFIERYKEGSLTGEATFRKEEPYLRDFFDYF